MKTATITYHAAHNYGAMLQAYALQQTLLSLGVENVIINYRSPAQRKHYPKVDDHPFSSFSHFAGWALHGGPFSRLHTKYRRFEAFLKEDLALTKEYTDPSQLSEAGIGADLYIAGSDQIWNTGMQDYDDVYFLPFVQNRPKISYAACLRLRPEEEADPAFLDRIRCRLAGFDAVSVRDEASRSVASDLSGQEVQVHPDPTLLFDRTVWERKAGDRPLVKGPYVFVYNPYTIKEMDDLALAAGRQLGMKVLLSDMTSDLNAYFRMKKYLSCGPWEFVNLVRHAAFVVTASYHGVIFSLLFHRPFYALDCGDGRNISLLEQTGMSDRLVSPENVRIKIAGMTDADFAGADARILKARQQGLEYLKQMVESGTHGTV